MIERKKFTLEDYEKRLASKLQPKVPVANNVLQRLMQKAREVRKQPRLRR